MNKQYAIKKRCLFKDDGKPFKISRSQIDRFVECPRCFYLDHRLGIRRPSMPGWPINSLVGRLLRKEFDVHRSAGTSHPIMTQYNLDSVPFQHEMMDDWRESFKGMTWFDGRTNLIIAGAIDDIWQNRSTNRLTVVDYKSTAKNGEITLDMTESKDKWKIGYQRQMEIYIWLLRKQGFEVEDRGFLLYANGRENDWFNQQVTFETSLLPCVANCDWIDPVILKIKACLLQPNIPPGPVDCEYCGYIRATGGLS